MDMMMGGGPMGGRPGMPGGGQGSPDQVKAMIQDVYKSLRQMAEENGLDFKAVISEVDEKAALKPVAPPKPEKVKAPVEKKAAPPPPGLVPPMG